MYYINDFVVKCAHYCIKKKKKKNEDEYRKSNSGKQSNLIGKNTTLTWYLIVIDYLSLVNYGWLVLQHLFSYLMPKFFPLAKQLYGFN